MEKNNLDSMIEVENNSNSSKFSITLNNEEISGKIFTLLAYTAHSRIKSHISIEADGTKILSEDISSEPSTFKDFKIPYGTVARLSVEIDGSKITNYRHGKQPFGYGYQFANEDAKGTFLTLQFKY